ncbi:MAG: NAD(P)-dependent oxidoreductase, partial [Nitrososphaerales archaeon]
MKQIGFVGLGQMGKPMARNLLKNHFSTAVFNRSKGPVRELLEVGAQESSSLVEMGRTCEVIVLSLPSPEVVRDVTLGANGITDSPEHSVKTIIDTSTIDPSTSREIELQLLGKGVNFLDAPVSGGPERAAEGTLAFMVGEKKETYEECLGILSAMGQNIFYMGKGGSGQGTKLV